MTLKSLANPNEPYGWCLVQILFKEITSGDIDAVRRRLAKNPEAVTLTATAPPKKYGGQSPLQVAYRNGRFEIAALLLEHGADPNFIETDSPWALSLPVVHHAITAAVMRSRWLRPVRFAKDRTKEQWRIGHTRQQADAAYTALQLLFESGADIHAVDSFGGSALGRAALDARQILPQYRHRDPGWVDPKPLNPELVDDLARIFALLRTYGADPNRSEPDQNLPVAQFYRAEPVGRFLEASTSASAAPAETDDVSTDESTPTTIVDVAESSAHDRLLDTVGLLAELPWPEPTDDVETEQKWQLGDFSGSTAWGIMRFIRLTGWLPPRRVAEPDPLIEAMDRRWGEHRVFDFASLPNYDRDSAILDVRSLLKTLVQHLRGNRALLWQATRRRIVIAVYRRQYRRMVPSSKIKIAGIIVAPNEMLDPPE